MSAQARLHDEVSGTKLAAPRTVPELALMLLDHLDGILNYCRTKVHLGVVEAVNGNIKSLLRRGRGLRIFDTSF